MKNKDLIKALLELPMDKEITVLMEDGKCEGCISGPYFNIDTVTEDGRICFKDCRETLQDCVVIE